MITLIRGDALALPLADDSVDLVVTSPPYWGLRDYGVDGEVGSESDPAAYTKTILAAVAEMARVLRPTGSIFLNIGDRYAARAGRNGPGRSLLMLPERVRVACADELGLTVRAVVVWHKSNGMPERVTDRVRRSHEDWVHLTLGGSYYADLDALRVPYDGDRALSRRVKRAGTGAREQRVGWSGEQVHPGGRLPDSVWRLPTIPLRLPDGVGPHHPAAFPFEWPRRLITGWCPPGGVVLDPFGGTGTTALVADVLGRTGISVDLSADYQDVARWRCSDARQRERAAGVAA